MKRIRFMHWVTNSQYDLIQQQLKSFKEYFRDISYDINKEKEKEAADLNNVCGHCGGTDLINVIRDVSGSSFPGLFNYGISIHTKPVNKCTKCGHEWHIIYPNYWSHEDSAYMVASDLKRFISGGACNKDLSDFLRKFNTPYAESLWLLMNERLMTTPDKIDWDNLKNIFGIVGTV